MRVTRSASLNWKERSATSALGAERRREQRTDSVLVRQGAMMDLRHVVNEVAVSVVGKYSSASAPE